jgi:WD40 repeat protein
VLQEGMRVHAKITSKSGICKYFPGRIVKISRNLYDIEIEGSKIESGLTMDDLVVGLQEGQQVEARKPSKVQLQCTSLDWNCTGNMVVATYGRNDLTGWCDIPGAVCSWNLSSRSLDVFNPDVVLDHSCSLMKVCCHPIRPSLVAAGSFNGEIIVWDLSNAEQSLATSPITEYSHKEPVTDLKWVYNPSGKSDEWLLISIGADGKVLFWSLDNKLRYPVKGFLMKKRKGSQKK